MSVSKYRPDIDGLRAIAVGSVIAFHAFPNIFKGGFVGVDVFFVISGFLISGIIFQAFEDNRFSYSDFYARRIKRIFPALSIVCITTLLVGWYVLLPDEFQRLGKQLAAGAGFVSNISLWDESGYFDAAAGSKPLLHLWSLGIEEQFYIVWPLVLGLLWKRKRSFLVITLMIAAVSFGINAVMIRNYPIATFYLPFSRFWELMVGGTLAYIAMHNSSLVKSYSNLQSIAGILLIAVGIAELNNADAFPGYWALLPTLGTFLVISAGTDAWLNKYILGNKLMVAIGLISYPLYLWHWPILVFAKTISEKLLTPTDRILAVVFTGVFAVMTYKFVELPWRYASSRIVPKILGLVMASIGVLGLLSFWGVAHSRLQTKNVTKILAATFDWEYPPVATQNHSYEGLRYFVEASKLGSYTLFVGDSNMEMYAPRIDRLIKEQPEASNGAVFVGNQDGCYLLGEILEGSNNCAAKVSKLNELIDQPSTRAVAIAASWTRYEAELIQPDNQERLIKFMQSIAAKKKVFLILNIPVAESLSPTNMFVGSRLDKIKPKPVSTLRFDMNRFEERFREINKVLADVAKKGGSVLIDPVETLCPQRRCPIFDETGNPLYRDSDSKGGHLTRSYAIKSATYIDVTLRP